MGFECFKNRAQFVLGRLPSLCAITRPVAPMSRRGPCMHAWGHTLSRPYCHRLPTRVRQLAVNTSRRAPPPTPGCLPCCDAVAAIPSPRCTPTHYAMPRCHCTAMCSCAASLLPCCCARGMPAINGAATRGPEPAVAICAHRLRLACVPRLRRSCPTKERQPRHCTSLFPPLRPAMLPAVVTS